MHPAAVATQVQLHQHHISHPVNMGGQASMEAHSMDPQPHSTKVRPKRTKLRVSTGRQMHHTNPSRKEVIHIKVQAIATSTGSKTNHHTTHTANHPINNTTSTLKEAIHHQVPMPTPPHPLPPTTHHPTPNPTRIPNHPHHPPTQHTANSPNLPTHPTTNNSPPTPKATNHQTPTTPPKAATTPTPHPTPAPPNKAISTPPKVKDKAPTHPVQPPQVGLAGASLVRVDMARVNLRDIQGSRRISILQVVHRGRGRGRGRVGTEGMDPVGSID